MYSFAPLSLLTSKVIPLFSQAVCPDAMQRPEIDFNDMYLVVGRLILDYHLDIDEFTSKYHGELSVADILQLDPGLSRYLEARKPADLRNFRQGSFSLPFVSTNPCEPVLSK